MKGEEMLKGEKLRKRVKQIERSVQLWESRLEDVENQQKSSTLDYVERIQRLESKYKKLKRKLRLSEGKVKDLLEKLESFDVTDADDISNTVGEEEEDEGGEEEVEEEDFHVNGLEESSGLEGEHEEPVFEAVRSKGAPGNRRRSSRKQKRDNSDPEDAPPPKISLKSSNMNARSIEVGGKEARGSYADDYGEPFVLIKPVNLSGETQAENKTDEDPVNDFQCEFCLKTYQTELRLLQHLRKHSFNELPQSEEPKVNGESFVEVSSTHEIRSCKICSKEFYLKKESKRNNIDFRCSHCRKATPKPYTPIPEGNSNVIITNNSLRSEKRPTYSSARVHKCQTCRKNFSSNSSLRRHSLIHSRPKPATTTVPKLVKSPEKKNSPPKELKKKDPVDRTMKKFRCGICKKEFQPWKEFEQHVELHKEASGVERRLPPVARGRASIKQISCLKCSKRFPSKEEQVKHFAVSHAWVKYKAFKCNVCNVGFSTRETLKKHQLRSCKTASNVPSKLDL